MSAPQETASQLARCGRLHEQLLHSRVELRRECRSQALDVRRTISHLETIGRRSRLARRPQ